MIRKTKNATMAQTARALIKAGKTDAEILEVLVREHGLDASDPKKKSYPAWYRAEIKRAERLVGSPAENAVGLSADDVRMLVAEVLEDFAPPAVDLAKVRQLVDAAVAERVRPTALEIRQAGEKPVKIEGAHFHLERLVRLVAAGISVYCWGPAGSGKTTAALQAAEALHRQAEIDTLDPSTFRSMVQGYQTPTAAPVHTTFTRCWSEGKIYVADECDNAPGHVQTLFNSALANDMAPLAWGNVKRHKKFGFIGTGNTPGRPTREFPDRRPMSAAFADRLYFIHWPLDPAIECRAVGLTPPKPPAQPVGKISPQAWTTFVQDLRSWSVVNCPTLMITPRASLLGTKALALGEAPEHVADALIFRGADAEIRRKALAAVPLMVAA